MQNVPKGWGRRRRRKKGIRSEPQRPGWGFQLRWREAGAGQFGEQANNSHKFLNLTLIYKEVLYSNYNHFIPQLKLLKPPFCREMKSGNTPQNRALSRTTNRLEGTNVRMVVSRPTNSVKGGLFKMFSLFIVRESTLMQGRGRKRERESQAGSTCCQHRAQTQQP